MFYLKHRPQTISELDNERIKNTLGKALLNNEFSHAYLLIGTRGSGKTTTARLIAKIVNCQKRDKGEEPCNKCESCLAVSEGRNLDVIEIDAASNTGVDDIRDLREKVKLAPVSSKYKVYIIDEVHMLSTSAFNALLKTLEEPPEHVIFVLATTDPQKLPQTIISRCLVYDFGKTSKAEIVNSLKRVVKVEKLNLTEDKLELIAEKADGSLRDAHKLLEQVSRGEEIVDVNLVRKKAEEILGEKEAKKAVLQVKEFVGTGGRVKDLILAMILVLRDRMIDEPENIELIEKLLEANSLVKDSPIPELPVEMVLVEYLEGRERGISAKAKNVVPDPEVKKEVVKEVVLDTSREEVTEVTQNSDEKETPDVVEVANKWPEFINAVKPYNHNLSALLRSSKPKEIKGDFLTIEAFYKFHKDKLSEEKNRQVLEKAISGIIGKDIKIKFSLKEV